MEIVCQKLWLGEPGGFFVFTRLDLPILTFRGSKRVYCWSTSKIISMLILSIYKLTNELKVVKSIVL